MEVTVMDGQGSRVLRAPTLTYSATVTAAGNAAIWTPASGRTFVLLGVLVSVNNTTTSAAGIVVSLRDGATDILTNLCDIGTTTAGITNTVSFGFGISSAAADNVLYVNLNAATTAGRVIITVWGYEK
jgi:hypothetical protein